MSFKDLNIGVAYESDAADLIGEFYLPVLSEAVQYDRISGFFTSSSLAISLRGIEQLIEKGGKMRLITSPRLSPQDINEISNALAFPEEYLTRNMLAEFDRADPFDFDYVKTLGWLIANNYLEIKIALFRVNGQVLSAEEVEQSNLFHQKVGILYDSDNNVMSFSGSINETAPGWVDNDEEFKVFKMWIPGQDKYVLADQKKFADYWSGSRESVEIVDLPVAVKEKLLEIGYESQSEVHNALSKRVLRAKSFDISLFPFQADAKKKWETEANKKMIFAMATGTGKTRTALACLQKCQKDYKRNLFVISTPQSTLSRQWIREALNLSLTFDALIEADSTMPRWRDELSEAIVRLNIRTLKNVAVFCTHRTSSSDDFLNLIGKVNSKVVNLVFIGDECHALGSTVYQKALLPQYAVRMGLSATPSRWFDDSGTQLLLTYFGGSQFDFTIRDALTTVNPRTNRPFLTQYIYDPIKVELTEDESEKFKSLTKSISKLYFAKDSDPSYAVLYERKLEERANVIKNAYGKYLVFENLIKSLDPKNLHNTIVFVSSEQREQVNEILDGLGVTHHDYTQVESAKDSDDFSGLSERQFIINKFREGFFQVLVAVKCLDEGIDIVTANRAILMASTTNPREYIQRIGRVIRYCEGKDRAFIHDLVVCPYSSPEHPEDFEKKIAQKELSRIEYIAEDAINNVSAIKKIDAIYNGGTD